MQGDRSVVKLRIMAKDADLVEWQAPWRSEIGGDRREFGDPLDEPIGCDVSRLETLHQARKGVTQSGNEVEKREVGIGERLADEMVAAFRVAGDHGLEIVQE